MTVASKFLFLFLSSVAIVAFQNCGQLSPLEPTDLSSLNDNDSLPTPGDQPESEASPVPPRLSQPIDFDQDTVDQLMKVAAPGEPGYLLNETITHSSTLTLTLIAYNKPGTVSSDGLSAEDRIVQQIRGLIDPDTAPEYIAGHHAWSDQMAVQALGVARHIPEIWNQLSSTEKSNADLIMEHILYFSNVTLNTNSGMNDQSLVTTNMYGGHSGSVPNQSSAVHAYGIGAYIYFGGKDEINKILPQFNHDDFISRLNTAGFREIAINYERPYIRNLMAGVSQPNGRPDPQGVKKLWNMMNTYSLLGSTPGLDNPYEAESDPVPAVPDQIFIRWGNEFATGATPKSNVGQDVGRTCNGITFGTPNGAPLAFEGEGRGMLYELNARGTVGTPPTRSSIDYAMWGMQQYLFMFATVSLTGYWNLDNPQHTAALEHARRAMTIANSVIENKWVSNQGIPDTVCSPGDVEGFNSEYRNLPLALSVYNTIMGSLDHLPQTPIVE